MLPDFDRDGDGPLVPEAGGRSWRKFAAGSIFSLMLEQLREDWRMLFKPGPRGPESEPAANSALRIPVPAQNVRTVPADRAKLPSRAAADICLGVLHIFSVVYGARRVSDAINQLGYADQFVRDRFELFDSS